MEQIGPYRVVRQVERGPAGTLYRGIDSIAGHTAAILAIAAGSSAPTSDQLGSARTLKHPNIVPIRDVIDLEGSSYVVMDDVQGSTLDTLHANQTLPKPAILLHLLNQIAAALDFAHQSSVFHGDLHARSIWIITGTTWADHAAKIVGFGLSGLATLDADHVQFAAMVYQLLAGTPLPLSANAPPLDQTNRTLDARADSIVRLALAGPGRRGFSNCCEFIQALSTALMECPGWRPAPLNSDAAKPAQAAERITGEPRDSKRSRTGFRSPVLAAVAMVALIAGLLAFATTRKPASIAKQDPPTPAAKVDPPKAQPNSIQPNSVRSNSAQPVKVEPPTAQLQASQRTTLEPAPPSLAPEAVTPKVVPSGTPIQPPKTVAVQPALLTPPKKAQGTMVVMSRPAGAEVKIDGVPVGSTPLTLHLKVGIHRLELVSLGRSHHETIIVSGDVITTRAVNWD